MTLRERLEDGITVAFRQYASYEDARQAGIINIAADAALKALRQWLADEGLVVVPRDATEEMVEAGYAAPDPTLGELVGRQLRTVQMKKAYTAMIAAAPDALRAEGE